MECPNFLGFWGPLSEIDLAVERAAEVPNCAAGLFRPGEAGLDSHKPWPPTQFNWAPSELYHQPLYFDDTPLERYGQSAPCLLQPWLSGAHFFACFPLMPYKLGLDRTHDRISTLGYYRAGSPAPKVRQRLPWELDAALLEVGIWSAVFLVLIP